MQDVITKKLNQIRSEQSCRLLQLLRPCWLPHYIALINQTTVMSNSLSIVIHMKGSDTTF